MRTAIILATLFLGLTQAGCSRHEAASKPAAEVVSGIRLVEAQRKPVPDYIDAVGTVRALQSSQLSAQIVGTVIAVNAHEGQQVRKGETLLVLDDAQAHASVQRASAAVNAARHDIDAADAERGLAAATLTRYQSLFEKKSVSPHEMEEVQARARMASARREQAQAGLEQAQAAEAQARTGLNFTRIRAPFDGVITAKFVDPGALASPGVALLSIEDSRRFRLEATVDEGDIHLVRRGSKAPVLIEAIGAELAGTVAEIVPAADPASRSFVVKVEVPADARLRSGLFGRARFPMGNREAVVLPASAIADRGQLHGVYVVGQGQTAGLRFVTLGRRTGEYVEVLSGLEGGERVVLEPGDRELSGKRIEGLL